MAEAIDYLLVGGGVASVSAAQAIRERDSSGRIGIVCDELHPPYDKPPLSKQYLLKDGYAPDDAYSKLDNFYPDNRVELFQGVRATSIDRAARSVALADGRAFSYRKLLLATGARARPIEVPGAGLSNVFTLRRIEDSEGLRTELQTAKKAVVIGAGFVGLEAAAACAERGIETTVVEVRDRPWPSIASAELGKYLRRAFEAKGVAFLLQDVVTAFHGVERAIAAMTRNGKRLAADVFIVGIGAQLNTGLAENAGLAVDSLEGVVVDRFLRTSDPNIWAAGDIALFEDISIGSRWHAEHHLNARWQGAAAGACMAGEEKPYDRVAYFFSDMSDIHVILRGRPMQGLKSKVFGDIGHGEFTELYHADDGAVRCGIAVSPDEPSLDPISDRLEAAIRDGSKVGAWLA